MNLPSIAIHSWHNASASVYHNGEIVVVVEFERLLNLKNASFEFFEPIHCQGYILPELYDYLKREYGFDRYDKLILSYGHGHTVPQHYRDAIPANEYIVDEAHHPAHACNSFYQSPYNEALIISFDGGSNDGFFNIYKGCKGQELELIKCLGIDLGCHYHVIGSFCSEIKNYRPLTAAGKVLGLQSYGKVVPEWLPALKEFFSHHPPYTSFLTERLAKMSQQIGITISQSEPLAGENSYNFARTAQQAFEELFYENTDEIIKGYPELPIVLTGGCALNITLNTNLKNRHNREIFIAPNSSDCGLTVGTLCKHFKPQTPIDITYKGIDVLDRSSLMEYVNTRIGRRQPIEVIVEDLVQNRILGVVQGRSEHGPRALGNRSIICSPLSSDMKDVLNAKVKHREWYRPFAPIVRLEDVSEYFEWQGESRWMNFCVRVKPQYTNQLLTVTHVDETARIQTITKEQNPFMYDLLTAFKARTGIGVLVNTSFNVDGKPILSSYRDAFKVFDETQLDRLYIEGYYFIK